MTGLPLSTGGSFVTQSISVQSYPLSGGGALGEGAPTVTAALTGFQLGVQIGAVSTPSTVALTGLRVGVRTGRTAAQGERYAMAWARVPAWLTSTLKSYLYIQYNDDDDLQAFVESQNTLQQELLDWLIAIELPIYTGPLIVGALLDWVALGLYGQARPTLPSGVNTNIGPYNTAMYDQLPYDGASTIESTDFFATTDDVFKRIITWNFYKGDGRRFTVRWLKRRVIRFLLGENGTDPDVDQTYQVSVGFGEGNHVDIRILSGLRTITGGALYDGFMYDEQPYNGLDTSFTQYAPLEFAPVFKAAVDSGALQMPFQYDWHVSI